MFNITESNYKEKERNIIFLLEGKKPPLCCILAKLFQLGHCSADFLFYHLRSCLGNGIQWITNSRFSHQQRHSLKCLNTEKALFTLHYTHFSSLYLGSHSGLVNLIPFSVSCAHELEKPCLWKPKPVVESADYDHFLSKEITSIDIPTVKAVVMHLPMW